MLRLPWRLMNEQSKRWVVVLDRFFELFIRSSQSWVDLMFTQFTEGCKEQTRRLSTRLVKQTDLLLQLILICLIGHKPKQFNSLMNREDLSWCILNNFYRKYSWAWFRLANRLICLLTGSTNLFNRMSKWLYFLG